MTTAKGAKRPNTPDAVMKSFLDKFNVLNYRHRTEKIFRDFAETSAIELSNPLDKRNYPKREARYIQIFRDGYPELKDRLLFGPMFADLVHLMAFGHDDVFGKIWTATDMRGNPCLGQTFTPYHLSKAMARMTLFDAQKIVDQHGFIKALEPACGPGGMIVAMAEVLLEQDINPQRALHVTAVDIDPLCVHMTYTQVSLHGIPGIIHEGDSLSGKMRDTWYTPFHILHGWDGRLAERDARDLLCPPETVTADDDLHAAWADTGMSERIRLVSEAGIENPSVVLDLTPPEGVMAALRQLAPRP